MIFPEPNTPVLGVDIGKVITNDRNEGSAFGDRYLEVPKMEGAFHAMWELYSRFRDQVYLISKCGGRMQVKTRHWLAHQEFHEFTKIPPDHVFFCEERKGKAPICELLGVTHMVDDKLEVHGHLQSVPNRYLFCPNKYDRALHKQDPRGIILVESWKELLIYLRKEV